MDTLKRLKRRRRDPLAPLVYVAIFGIGAFILFLVNWLTHPW